MGEAESEQSKSKAASITGEELTPRGFYVCKDLMMDLANEVKKRNVSFGLDKPVKVVIKERKMSEISTEPEICTEPEVKRKILIKIPTAGSNGSECKDEIKGSSKGFTIKMNVVDEAPIKSSISTEPEKAEVGPNDALKAQDGVSAIVDDGMVKAAIVDDGVKSKYTAKTESDESAAKVNSDESVAKADKTKSNDEFIAEETIKAQKLNEDDYFHNEMHTELFPIFIPRNLRFSKAEMAEFLKFD